MKEAEKTEFLSGGPIYGVFATAVPMFFLGAVTFLGAVLVPIRLPVFRVMIVGLASTLAASVYYDMLRDRLVNHTVAHIRGGVVVTIFAYGVISLCAGLSPVGRGFVPGLANMGAALASLYTWAMTLVFKQIFRGQRQFEKFAESLNGEALRTAVIENPELINVERINQLKKTILTHFAVIGVFVLAAAFSKTSVVLPLLVFLIFTAAVCVCMLGFLALMKQEYAFAGEGLSILKAFRLRQILGIFLFASMGVVIALLLASNRSLLPPSLIVRFFAWLASLFDKPLPPDAEHILFSQSPPPLAPLGQQLADTFGATQPWAGWKYVQRGLVTLAILAFLFFMLKPLFKDNFFGSFAKGRANFKRIWKEFSEWLANLKNWRRIIRSIISFFKYRDARRLARKEKSVDIFRVSSELLEAYKSTQKKKIQQSVNLFARLIIWGRETFEIAWKPSFAPGEFCTLLAFAVPEQERRDMVIRCGALFEQSLYSQNELTPAENNEFTTLVEELVKYVDETDPLKENPNFA
ncbi:MAG: hypothetical protein LBE74_03605 [Treponema sp.]|jgi:hypothetical protein|nr:hypothetical protein [Treponema sp.]